MPGWHAATQHLTDKLKTVGIIVEQHPERTRLFMQWQGMNFPLMHDPFNLLELPFVPVTLMLDEHGIIRLANPKQDMLDEIERQFLDQPFAPPTKLSPVQTTVPDLANVQAAGDPLAYADALTLWGDEGQLEDAVDVARQAVQQNPTDRAHFHLGVIYRKRYDSALRQDGDFQNAVAHWTEALKIDPNNYIWRRRIQQYGPRLDKPYSFYDWVTTARQEIEARGETPLPLWVEPGGAEFAYPVDDFGAADNAPTAPDADGRIARDEGLIAVETTVVPAAVAPGDSTRLHITLLPTADVHWNNEVDDLVLWLDLPDGWQADQQALTVPNPAQATSHEPRKLEVEVRSPTQATPGAVELAAYALYYVCEDTNGVCLYRRQDIPLLVTMQPETGQRLRDGG